MHSHVSAEPVRRALEVENPRGSGCVVIEHASDASASHSYFNAFYISHGSWAKHEAPLGNLRQLRGTAMSVRLCPLSRNRKKKKKENPARIKHDIHQYANGPFYTHMVTTNASISYQCWQVSTSQVTFHPLHWAQRNFSFSYLVKVCTRTHSDREPHSSVASPTSPSPVSITWALRKK